MMSKAINKAIGGILTQNKGQASALSDALKNLPKIVGGMTDSGAMKSIIGDLTRTLKLVEAQTQVLSGIEVPETDARADKDEAAQARELQDLLKRMIDENGKQAGEIEDIAREIEGEAKGGGGRDQAKKIKAATDAIEKARKLVDEQSKLLEEARKALSD